MEGEEEVYADLPQTSAKAFEDFIQDQISAFAPPEAESAGICYKILSKELSASVRYERIAAEEATKSAWSSAVESGGLEGLGRFLRWLSIERTQRQGWALDVAVWGVWGSQGEVLLQLVRDVEERGKRALKIEESKRRKAEKQVLRLRADAAIFERGAEDLDERLALEARVGGLQVELRQLHHRNAELVQNASSLRLEVDRALQSEAAALRALHARSSPAHISVDYEASQFEDSVSEMPPEINSSALKGTGAPQSAALDFQEVKSRCRWLEQQIEKLRGEQGARLNELLKWKNRCMEMEKLMGTGAGSLPSQDGAEGRKLLDMLRLEAREERMGRLQAEEKVELMSEQLRALERDYIRSRSSPEEPSTLQTMAKVHVLQDASGLLSQALTVGALLTVSFSFLAWLVIDVLNLSCKK